MKTTFFSLLVLSHGLLHAMADISFVVIDLKYNQRQGVKICEIQPGSFSRFSGSDTLEEMNIVSDKYCDFLAKYDFQGYFTHPLYQKMKQSLIEHGWASVHSPSKIAPIAPPLDKESLFDYRNCLFSLNSESITRGDPDRFPHILFLDRAILPYSQNKYRMNDLLDKIEETKRLRPTWSAYPKGSSDALIHRILLDIPGDLLVLKPIESTMGRGVIIIEKKDLKATLNYIFHSPKEVLIQDLDRSYSHYARDLSSHFIVEEFISSDPLFLGQDSLPYDCTLRIAAILSCHKKNLNLTVLSKYWYSPSKPIHSSYTLIQSHKAKGSYFEKVDPRLFEEIQKQLSPALLKAYQHMLDQYDIQFP